MPKHHIIYITGLGDANAEGQRKAVSTWRRFGVEPQLFQMNWIDREPFAPKLGRLVRLIDSLVAKGGKVSLVGVSAGGGVALNAYAQRKSVISGVVTVCGKFNYPQTVSPRLIAKNPAFGESMAMVADSRTSLTPEDLRKVMSIYPLFDESVPAHEAKLAGTHQKRVLSVGHVITIALMISVRAATIIRFLKKQIKANN